jgi:hypothetical protein
MKDGLLNITELDEKIYVNKLFRFCHTCENLLLNLNPAKSSDNWDPVSDISEYNYKFGE